MGVEKKPFTASLRLVAVPKLQCHIYKLAAAEERLFVGITIFVIYN